ncbi:MAG: glycerol-3-phosphate dehydrogenase/oxidase [Candidatus Omnitrophica bacterium]|nr:glycerol-3-phosphate dehydrogenase/oxidase [Candidatus Omnitrophota bacterium]
MTRDPSRLAGRTFDLLIVGGGIVGAGIAWDASMRGLSCALVEQGDFAGGTSSKTTKLIHGGIRYLENLDFGLVRRAIEERQTLLRLAPDLVKPLPFLIPVQGGSPRPWPLVRLGVTLYDLLALRPGSGQAGPPLIQRHRLLDQAQVQEAEPLLSGSGIRRGAIYTDAQMDDARLVLEVLKSAAGAGAAALNYMKVDRWILEGGRVVGAELEDQVASGRYQVRAAAVVNATGPWVDRLRRLADPSAKPMVRPSKGIHLVYPDLGLRQALLLSSAKDRRIFFLIPWQGLTLIGTTDTDYQGDPAEARADSDEVEYLIRETNRLLPRLKLERKGVLTTFAGVRPLVAQERKDPWAVSRMHLLHEDPNGLLSVVGGKFTTFRRIAEETVDWLGPHRFPGRSLSPCRTGMTPLGPAGHSRRVEIRAAVEEEMALSLSDLLWRRWGIGGSISLGPDRLLAAAEEMGRLLGWSAAERDRQIELYKEELRASRRALNSGRHA